MTATWPDPDPGWRVRAGVGLVEHTPMSDAQREAVAAETEKERLADEAKAKLADESKFESDAERDWYLQRHGLERVSVGDVLARASAAQDRQDRRDARIEREAAEILGRPDPRHRPYTWEIAKKQAEQFEHEQSPATVGQLHEVQGKLAHLSAKLFAATGRKKV